ncbi:rRNA maturation RNase YbeY [Candidiatus Paracoxiella cheracis]|uniref:rRNA maturation RNase YbeY n=1 Tax=Candidiatus Paracoxiella cheracis TaxID=3405120 RepID=UPI003BF46C5B
MSIVIELQNNTTSEEIPSLSQFTQWTQKTLSMVPKSTDENKISLTIRIIDEAESASLNQTYRQKKGPTNILSFPDDPIPGFISDSLGDLAICAPLVLQEANAQHKQTEAHWAHLLVHGVLHLLNYDHINDEDAEVMEALEIKILEKLGYNNPYE